MSAQRSSRSIRATVISPKLSASNGLPAPPSMGLADLSACSTGDEPPCEPAAGSLLKSARKAESISDRIDALLLGGLISTLSYLFTSHWDVALEFNHDKSPFLLSHSWSLPIVSCCLYVLMVHVIGPFLRRSESESPAFGISEGAIKSALKYWNLFLSVLSICMFVGMGVPMVMFVWQNGFVEGLCDSKQERWQGPAWFWMYIFAVSKYLELADTAFLVVRRKPVSFLHWYHHTSVLCYTWFACVVGFCPGWMFAIINSFVHTIMYFYYYRAACGVRLSYDRLVTTIQLAQMVIGVAATSTWAVLHYVKNDGAINCPCKESGWAMAFAFVIYGSYFLLFLSFYLKRYTGAGKSKGRARME